MKLRTTAYPEIGQSVTFLKENINERAVEEGSGVILSICLDANKRLMAHVLVDNTEKPDGNSEKINVDVQLLNPTPEKKQAFQSAVEDVKSIVDEGNGKIQELVEEYNRRTQERYDEVLGRAVKIEGLN